MMDAFDYSNPDYWDQRYKKQTGTFEWYALKWNILNETLSPHVFREHRILHLGTGNSALPQQMHDDGYHNQLAVDISATVISQMKEKYVHLAPRLEFSVEDCLKTSFPDASFDVIIEKGTLEALSADRNCGLDMEGCTMLPVEKQLFLEGFRILKPGGLFVSIADEVEDFPELRAQGLVKLETVKIREDQGIPVPKVLFKLFKGNLADTSRQEV